MEMIGSGLDALRVIEWSGAGAGRTACAYAGKLFAGFGAEVLKVSLQPAAPVDCASAWLDTGKTAIILRTDDDAELARLLLEADVVLDGGNALAAAGWSAARLLSHNPRLVLLQITAFGQQGPRRHWQADDITLYAMSGLMHSTGEPGREPLNSATPMCECSAGLKGFAAALIAIHARSADGKGDAIDLAIFEAALDNYEVAIAEYLNVAKVARRNGDEHAMVPWRTYPCRDGLAAVVGGPVRHWPQAVELFGIPELAGPDFAHMSGRIRNRAAFQQLMAPWLLQRNKQAVYHAGQAAGLAWAYVATLDEALASPQAAARGSFVEIDIPGLGQCRMPAAPFAGSDLRWSTQPLQQASDSRLLWRGRRPSTLSAPARSSTALPLAGLKVIDFTHDWAGPHAARLLADYGAEVIKIEHPQGLDGMRGGYAEKVNEFPRFWQINRNKQSVTLDLKVAAQLEACKRLIADADVVVENSRPGVMPRLGLGFEALRVLNPRLVMVSMSAFGATGPESQYAGYGGSIEALSGLQSLTAYQADGTPLRVREMDVFNGVMGACAAMAGLAARDANGRGQWIDLSETEAATWLMGEAFVAHTLHDATIEQRKLSQPRGNRHPRFVQGCYRCAGADRYLVLTVRDDLEWQRLTAVLGNEALSRDARFTDAASRLRHHDAIDAVLADWCANREADAIAELLQAADLAAGPVNSVKEIAADPQLAARDWIIEAPDGRYPGFPFRFARRGGGVHRRRGPDLGADNTAILGQRCGLPMEAWPDLRPEALGTAYDEIAVAPEPRCAVAA